MGTRFECVLYGDDERFLRAAGEEAIEVIEDAHRRLSRFEPGGPIWSINAAAGVAACVVDDEIFELLSRCERVRLGSDGAFDIVRSASGARTRAISPTSGGMLLDADTRRVGVIERGMMIDLGGVAKGFAIDRARETLIEAGVTSAFLHGGGSTMIAIGSPPAGLGAADIAAWPIGLGPDGPGVEGPCSDGPCSDGLCSDEPVAGGGRGSGRNQPRVMLRDLALSVSSQDGDRRDHIVDPRADNGPTAGRTTRWAGCLAASAEASDAWATALVVLGTRPERMPGSLTSIVACRDSDGTPRLSAIGPGRSSIVMVQDGTDAAIGSMKLTQ